MPKIHLSPGLTAAYPREVIRLSRFLAPSVAATVAAFTITQLPVPAQATPLIASIDKETIWRNRDGGAVTWFHPQSDTVLALGHVVFYKGPRFSRGDQLARYPVYATRAEDDRGYVSTSTDGLAWEKSKGIPSPQ